MIMLIRSGLFSFICVLAVSAQNMPLFRRFEYKHSFCWPHLAQRDGSIPFWVVQGDAIASSEQLRLAPSMRSQKGLAWNKRPMMSENFEIEVEFKVTGPGRIGADGMAVWYTKNMGSLGPVYGANDYWTGLAVLMDSYDNDAKQNNPYISVMINDGTRSYDHHSDGSNQVIGGCKRDFRNQKFSLRVRVEYVHNVLTISTTDGKSGDKTFEPCLRAENIFLPKNGYFGVSAATGGLADDHDVLEFSTTSLLTEAQRAAFTHHTIPQDERQKYDAEFAKQQQEYEQERKKFKEQHPDKVKEEEDDPSKYYEDATSRELRFIHENQANIYRTMQQIEAKLAEIMQKQNLHTGMLQQQAQQIGISQAATSGQNQQPLLQQQGSGGEFLPHEKNEVLQSLRDLTTSIRDMRNYVNEIFTRSYNIEQKIAAGSTQQQSTNGQISSQQDTQQIRAYLDTIQNEIRQVRANQQHASSTDTTTGADVNCATPTLLIGLLLIQSAIFLTFTFFRSKPDKAKFY